MQEKIPKNLHIWYIDSFGKESLKEKISFAKITRSQAERLRDYLARY